MSADGPPKFTPRKDAPGAVPSPPATNFGQSPASPDPFADDVTVPAATVAPQVPVADPPPAVPQPPPAPAQHASPSDSGAKAGPLGVPMWVLVAGAVGAIVIVGALAWLVFGRGGGSGAVVVLEPRRNGNVDMHQAEYGEPLNNLTEVAGDVQTTGAFIDLSDTVVRRRSSVMAYEGGLLVGLRTDDEAMLGLVKDGELIELADDDGDLFAVKLASGRVVALWVDSSGEQRRCSMYLLDGVEADRFGRGELCDVLRGDRAYIVDNGDVSVFDLVSGEELEVGETTGDRSRAAVNGDLVVIEEFDVDSLQTELLLFPPGNPASSQSIELEERESIALVAGSGVLTGVEPELFWAENLGSPISPSGTAAESVLWYSAVDGSDREILSTGNPVSIVPNPSSEGAVFFESSDFARDEDFDLHVWRVGEAEPRAVPGGIDGFRLARWVSDDVLVIVDWEGLVYTLGLDGTLTEIGELDDYDPDDVSWIRSRITHDGQLLISVDPLEDDRGVHSLVDPAGASVTTLLEASSVQLVSGLGSGADRLVVEFREDAADDEWILAEWSDGRLVEFDEADGLFTYHFEGDDLFYSARTGDDEDDVEVRRYRLGSSDDPERVFDEATIRTANTDVDADLGWFDIT